MTGAEFGPCAHCEQDAIVKVNNVPCCTEHMNKEFHGIGETVREIIKAVYSGGP